MLKNNISDSTYPDQYPSPHSEDQIFVQKRSEVLVKIFQNTFSAYGIFNIHNGNKVIINPTPGFLSLGGPDTLCSVIVVGGGGCTVHHREISSIPGFYPPEASLMLPLTPIRNSKKYSRHCQISPGKQKSPLVKNCWPELCSL